MSSNIHFVQLEAYKAPKTVESNRNDWVDFGDDNNYYQFLIDAYNNSTTNNAIINAISKLIYGKGLDATDSNKKPNEYAQMKMLFRKDMLKKSAIDLKMLGQFAIQLIYNKTKDAIIRTEHIPVHLLRAKKCNDKGEITAYYYSDNWEDVKKFVPKEIPAFGYGDKTLEILFVGNYTVGQKYYSNVDYIGSIPYAKLEEEISDYLINDVQKGFSGRTVINFNNGIPDEEKQQLISSKVKGQLTGSGGDPVIVSFNNSDTEKTTVDSIPLNDAPAHYSYLSEESRGKILLGHRVTSGLLFGIQTANGFSSNADELKNASVLFDNTVIVPFQETILDALDQILAFNQVSLNLKFIPLNLLDAAGELTGLGASNAVIDSINSLSPLVANKVLESMTANEIRDLVGLKAELGGSDLPTAPTMLSKHLDDLDLSQFGEDLDPAEWELVDSRKVDYDSEDSLDAELERLNNPKKSLLSKVYEFVTTGVARPNVTSEQDGVLFVSRYRYSGETTDKSRPFCKKMTALNKLYRKEDIIQMGNNSSTNPGWGPKGTDTYSVWLSNDYKFYKGGGSCHHYWSRETYRRIGSFNKKGTNKAEVTPSAARKEGEIVPVNDKLVYTKPIDMPYQGFLPTNKRFN